MEAPRLRDEVASAQADLAAAKRRRRSDGGQQAELRDQLTQLQAKLTQTEADNGELLDYVQVHTLGCG